MLEQINADIKLTKEQYRARMPALQQRLFELQRSCWESGVGVLVAVEGWSGAGKGKAIKKITERLEPRAFEIHALRAARTDETYLPWMYRFWVRLPSYGKLAIFSHSWYRRVLDERLDGTVAGDAIGRAFDDINAFERALADDRYTIVKLFLHIDEGEQAKRLKKLESNQSTAWRVTARDWDQHEAYDDHRLAVEEMLAHTETEWAPWTLIESGNGRFARVKIFETLINRLEQELGERVSDMRPEIARGRRTRFELTNDELVAAAADDEDEEA